MLTGTCTSTTMRSHTVLSTLQSGTAARGSQRAVLIAGLPQNRSHPWAGSCRRAHCSQLDLAPCDDSQAFKQTQSSDNAHSAIRQSQLLLNLIRDSVQTVLKTTSSESAPSPGKITSNATYKGLYTSLARCCRSTPDGNDSSLPAQRCQVRATMVGRGCYEALKVCS